MISRLRSLMARYTADERGNTAAIVAVCIVFLLGTAAMATDMGYLYTAKLKLQASADAAALAGATMISTTATADPKVEATSFSALPGDKNAQVNFTASMASGSPTLLCLNTLKAQNDPCISNTYITSPAGANAIRVVENAQVPSFFSKVFGVSFFTISATAPAAARGGQPKPLDVEVILDTTASMNPVGSDPNCGLGASASRIQCAKTGLQTLLMALSPSVQYVGLLTFPGFPNAQQAKQDVNCSGTTPTTTPYFNSPIYQIAALSNDYRSSNGATTLKSSSNVAQASGGVSGCPGLSAPGGQGTYLAEAIKAAQADLVANGHTGAKRAIIVLSDGEANAKNAVQSITVTNTGANYNAAPNVVFSGGGGSGAAGTAVMSGSGSTQKVASVTITNMGSGYTSTPTVAFNPLTGKTGSGAAGTVVLTAIPGTQQCHQTVTQGQAATTAGTEVYTVAYGSALDSGLCTTDLAPAITPCLSLEQAASSLADFYSDGSGGTACPNAQPVTTLAAAFQSIASSITAVRLIPDTWT